MHRKLRHAVRESDFSHERTDSVRCFVAPLGLPQRFGKALATVSLLIGALTMSRVVKDPELSTDILQSAQKHITNS